MIPGLSTEGDASLIGDFGTNEIAAIAIITTTLKRLKRHLLP